MFIRRREEANGRIGYSARKPCHVRALPSSFPIKFNLAELLRRHAGRTLEFKRDPSSLDK
jgi:hypothetical protein